jgi:hypothetical protein
MTADRKVACMLWLLAALLAGVLAAVALRVKGIL